jgi:hypothetical protein
LNGVFYCKPHFKQLFALKGNYSDGFRASSAVIHTFFDSRLSDMEAPVSNPEKNQLTKLNSNLNPKSLPRNLQLDLRNLLLSPIRTPLPIQSSTPPRVLKNLRRSRVRFTHWLVLRIR